MTKIRHICISKMFLGLAMAENLIAECTNEYDFVIILDRLWEQNIIEFSDEITKFISLINEKKPQWKIYLFLNSSDEIYHERLQSVGSNGILFLDYFLYRVYRESVIHKKNKICTRSAPSSFDKNKFLFLTGKARPARVKLLKKMVDSGLINHSIWSFFGDSKYPIGTPTVKSILGLTDSEAKNFIETYSRSPDNVSFKSNFEYNGLPYDVKMYSDTDFSVINETSCSEIVKKNPWITEKTWIPILNGHPFIIMGDVGILGRLRQLEFYTFENFLEIDYDAITNNNIKIDAVLSNIVDWVENLHKHKEELNFFIESNTARLGDLYLINYDKILNFIRDHGLSDFSVDDLVITTGRAEGKKLFGLNGQNRFVPFYNNIKAADWPECELDDDFLKLPKYIQDECVNVYGYVPPTGT